MQTYEVVNADGRGARVIAEDHMAAVEAATAAVPGVEDGSVIESEGPVGPLVPEGEEGPE